MTDLAHNDSPWRRPVLAGILLLTVFLGARGITDESSVMLGGDMARYLMNGVFLHDLAADGGVWSVDGLADYAERYYARYPALSLGHHPPLAYVALVPFFAVFGISVFAARMAELFWFVLAAWSMYAVSKRLFGWQAASWATVLLVTNPLALRYGQRLLSEMPMLALVLVSIALLLRYCDTRRPAHFVWFVLAVAASLYAKQLAIFMFPVYAVILATRLRSSVLRSRRVLWLMGIGVVLVTPLALMTLGLAPANIHIATRKAIRVLTGSRGINIAHILQAIITTHLSVPTMVLAIAGTVALIVRRNREVVTLVVWALSCIGGSVIFAGGIESARYAFCAVPACLLLGASLANEVRAKTGRVAAAIALSGAVLWQAWSIRNVYPTGAGGYETAAQYVVDHSREPVVLFDSVVDTGYFVFFVRKHDAAGRLVVLRADKLLIPASRRQTAPGEQPWSPAEIYSTLRKFGVQYLVVEERQEGALVLRTLHDELRTGRFVERQRIPIISGEPMVRGVDLVVYEFTDAQPADPDAELDIDLPLGKREIKLRMRDLIGPGAR